MFSNRGAALVWVVGLWGLGCWSEPDSDRGSIDPLRSTGELGAEPALSEWFESGKSVRFADVTQAAGLDFVHVSGSREQRYILQAMGSGSAFFDFDADGWLDFFAVNGTRLEDAPETGNRLWRNVSAALEGRAFADATQDAGLGQVGWGMGAAVADYDNDGDLDLYVTYWGPNVLYRNEGNGVFTAVEAGTEDRRWGTSAAFGDVDMDGWLDLYVANYVVFDLDDPPGDGELCSGWKGLSVFCGPHGLDGEADVLFRNQGDGSFADMSVATEIDQQVYLGLGVLFTDFDGDGDQDLYIANDSTPNLLYRNDGDWQLREVGAFAGVAYSEEGRAQAGMGLDSGDYDNDGDPDLLVTNFSDDVNTLYKNLGGGIFADATHAAGLGGAVRPFLGWSTALADFDLDGWLDLFVANGHLYPQLESHPLGLSYRQRNLLYWNQKGRFELASGVGLDAEQVSRGTAFGDYDNDGDLDLVVNNLNDRPSLLRNDGGNRNNWLGLDLIGAEGRPIEGTSVRLWVGGQQRVQQAKRGYGYLSASDGRVLFGLGGIKEVQKVEVRWPSGRVQVVERPLTRRYLILHEGEEAEMAHYNNLVQVVGPALASGAATLAERVDAPSVDEVAFDPDWTAEMYYERATALYGQSRYFESLALLQPAIRHNPDENRLYYAAGVVLYSGLGRYQEAIEVLERAMAQDSSLVEVARLLGVVYLHSDQPARSIVMLERARTMLPGHWETHYRIGLAHNRLGARQAAISAFERARTLAPGEPMPSLHLARTYEFLGQGQAAREALHHFEKQQPLKHEIDRYRQAIRAKPGHPVSYAKLGLALAQTGRLEEAQRELERSLELAPDDAETWTNLANILLRRGATEEAMAAYRRALKQDGELAEAHYGLGMSHYAQGETTEALNALGRALELRPDFLKAHINMGVVLEDLDRLEEALLHFRRAVVLAPNDARTGNNLVVALARVGQVDQAKEVLERAAERRVDLPFARKTLVRTLVAIAQTHADQGQLSEAIARQRQAIELTPSRLQAELLEQLRLYESSIQ
ncbi:MAG: FG-GAP-like repeat-containing protein [Candidatus Latescibacterota bacterium]|nr:FG-GAP-like repeat-containing protein [Candidatus Latescibacterota bacterium]